MAVPKVVGRIVVVPPVLLSECCGGGTRSAGGLAKSRTCVGLILTGTGSWSSFEGGVSPWKISWKGSRRGSSSSVAAGAPSLSSRGRPFCSFFPFFCFFALGGGGGGLLLDTVDKVLEEVGAPVVSAAGFGRAAEAEAEVAPMVLRASWTALFICACKRKACTVFGSELSQPARAQLGASRR